MEKIKLDTDIATLSRIRESIIATEELQLYIKVAKGQALYNDLEQIEKLIENETTKQHGN